MEHEQKTDGELLPCPFCGGEADMQTYDGRGVEPSSAMIGCDACDMCSTGWRTSAQLETALGLAIRFWNTRQLPPVSREIDELLRDMRVEVEYSHVATMPIPLYERMKEAIKSIRPRNTGHDTAALTQIQDALEFYSSDNWHRTGFECRETGKKLMEMKCTEAGTLADKALDALDSLLQGGKQP